MELTMTITVKLLDVALEELNRNREYFEKEILGNSYLKSTKQIRYVGEVTEIKNIDYLEHEVKE